MSFITNFQKKIDPVGAKLGNYKGQEAIEKALTPDKPTFAAGPTDADIAAAADLEAQAEQRRLARGRTSTMLTGGTGLTDMGRTSRILLGQ